MKLHQFLTKQNWVKHAGNCVTTFCLVEAIRHFEVKYNKFMRAETYFLKQELKVWSIVGIIMWNDAPERTFEEVHAVLVKLDI